MEVCLPCVLSALSAASRAISLISQSTPSTHNWRASPAPPIFPLQTPLAGTRCLRCPVYSIAQRIRWHRLFLHSGHSPLRQSRSQFPPRSSFRQFDFSVFKDTTHLTERVNMQLRFAAYNLSTTPTLPIRIRTLSPIRPSRRYFYGPGLLSPDGYWRRRHRLSVLGSGGPRSMQLAAKFTC